MRRDHSRTGKMGAFQASAADLSGLIDRMRTLMGDANARVSIELSLRSGKVRFDSLDELRACSEVPSTLSDFEIEVASWKDLNDVRTVRVFTTLWSVATSN